MTSLPGIGYTAWYAGNGFPYTGRHTFDVTTTYTMKTAVDITFYKIGNVTPGTIRASDLPLLEQVMIGDTAVRANVWQYVGSLNIVSRTCTTPDVAVNLGDHLTTELSAVGEATTWVDLTLSLQDCPAYNGAFRRHLSDENGFRQTEFSSNQLQYRVDATTSIVDGPRSVMALSNAGAAGTATGVGIQVVDASESPIGFGTTRSSGLTLTTVDGETYTIPLKARYMQTAANVTAGTANGQATVTFVYQ
jgi:type 1 fimbria pilin